MQFVRKDLEVDGLGQVAVHAGPEAFVFADRLASGCRNDRERRDRTYLLPSTNLFRCFYSSHDWHIHVHKHHVRRAAAAARERLRAVPGHVNFVAQCF